MNPHARTQLLECLCQLASSSFQERVWVRGEGPEVSSYPELACQLFDDTALGDILASGTTCDVFGAEAAAELQRLAGLIEGLPARLEPRSLRRDPAWTLIMESARKAADILAKDELRAQAPPEQ